MDVSRSGRVRKKSAKLMEMEEEVSPPPPEVGKPRLPSKVHQPQEPLKLRLSLAGLDTHVEPRLEDLHEPLDGPEEEVVEEVVDAVVPPLRIKLGPRPEPGESAANKLFKQITTGQVQTTSPPKKKAKKLKVEEVLPPITDSEESLMAAPENSNSGSKKKPGDKDKEKKKTFCTAYTLWSRENRPKIAQRCPGMDFSAISKRLGEIWQTVPKNEKMQWKKRAQKVQSRANQGMFISTGPPPTPPKPVRTPLKKKAPLPFRPAVTVSHVDLSRPVNPTTLEEPGPRQLTTEPLRTIGTGPLEVAAHLKVLGESLSGIGQRLVEADGQVAVSGSLSLLLDSTLCALGPLLCLTQYHPTTTEAIAPQTLRDTLDNIGYFMPGI